MAEVSLPIEFRGNWAVLLLQRVILRWVLIAGIAAGGLWVQWVSISPRPIWALGQLVEDRLIRLNASNEPESRLVVIDIDEASLTTVAPWPWPRATIADLVETLVSDYRVQGVALDIVFPAPADTLGDQRLAALAQVAPLVLAQAFDFVLRDPPTQTGQPVTQSLPGSMRAWHGHAPTATGYIANHSGLQAAPCVGNIGVLPDSDGQIRSVPLVTEWQHHYSLLLPLAMLDCQQTARHTTALSAMASTLVPPLSGTWRVPYTRHWSAYTVISAQDILLRKVDPHWLEKRWVLVGSSALGLSDRATTPLGSSVAGVMVHAAVLTSLLDQAQSSSPPLWSLTGKTAATVWILLTLAFSAWALSRWRAWVLLPLTAAYAVVWLLMAAWLLRQQLSFNTVSPLLAYAALFVLAPLEWWLTQRDQGQLLRTFAGYVAPTVLSQMVRQGVNLPLVPRYCQITVLSADMQDYSGLTHTGSLQDAAQLTREFLQCLTAPILSQQGTLDKYTGDGLVAFWGAPLPMNNHADQAIRAGLQMVEHVHAWNLLRHQQGKPMARVRIGIESGSALVGDLGTQFRRTYTAVGDCINTASKLQNAAKTHPHDLIIGHQAAQLTTAFSLIEIGTIRLSGQNQPLPLYTPSQGTASVPLLPSAAP